MDHLNKQSPSASIDADSIEEPFLDSRATHPSKSVNYCIRCRLLGIACDRRVPQCQGCEQASVDCLTYPAMVSDRLFNLVPQRPSLGNTAMQPHMHMNPPSWTKASTGKEFLSEETGDSVIPDDISTISENPLRNQSGHGRLEQLQAGPLKTAILNFPIESCSPDPDSEQSPLQMPLPSSDLLDCISRTIAQAEASSSPPFQSPSLNESLGGSCLLALGVLLQEYTQHLL